MRATLLTLWPILLIRLPSHGQRLNSPVTLRRILPGYRPSVSDTYFARGFSLPVGRGNSAGGVVVGRPRYDASPPDEAFINVPMGNGRVLRVPKGIYEKTETETEYEGDLQLPDVTNPVSFLANLINGKTKTKQKNSRTNGVYIPLPFGMRPLNIQLMRETLDGVGSGAGLGLRNVLPAQSPPENVFLQKLHDSLGTAESHLMNSVRENLWQRVRYYCRFGREACDRALQAYYERTRTNSIPYSGEKLNRRMANGDFSSRLASNLMHVVMPALQREMHNNQQRALQQSSNFGAKVGGVQQSNQKGESTGIYVGVPGLRPFYLGGFMNSNQTNGYNIGLDS